MRLRLGALSAANERLRCSRVTFRKLASVDVRTGRPACDTMKRHADLLKRRVQHQRRRRIVQRAREARREARTLHELARDAVVDAIDEHVGELVRRALRERRSLGRAQRDEPEERNARILSSERGDAPRLFLRRAEVDERRVDEIRLERGVEVVERARREQPAPCVAETPT